jgi:CBS domain-containing protein
MTESGRHIESRNQWVELLEKTKIPDLIPAQRLITISPTDKMSDVLHTLKDHDIIGVPVTDDGQLLGFVDMLDITAYAHYLWKRYSKIYHANYAKFSEFSDAKNRFFSTEAKEIMNFSSRDAPPLVSKFGTGADVVFQLARRSFKAHKVAVLDEKLHVTNIISQSDLLKLAEKNFDKIPQAQKNVQELGLIRTCLMVRFDVDFADALEKLADNRVSGIALVDWENKLVANFSTSVLRGITTTAFDLFRTPLLDFLRFGTSVKSRIPPISCKADTPLKDIIHALLQEKIHRIFITNANEQPVGVVTLTDVIHILCDGVTIEE